MYKNFSITGQQSHSSKFPCHICTGFREDQQGAFPGDERGRWKPGPLRSHNSNMADYNGFRVRTEGMSWTRAKEFGSSFHNVTSMPIQLHEDPDLPYLHYIMFDPLHLIKLGKLNLKHLKYSHLKNTPLAETINKIFTFRSSPGCSPKTKHHVSETHDWILGGALP